MAIMVGLSLALLVGMVGLAIDGGRLYLTKTELQNAADACALAASYELTGAPAIAPEAFDRAVLVGKEVGSRNKVLFQQQNIASGDIAVSFGTALNSGAWVPAPAPGDAKYVRCVVRRENIPYYFMPAFNSAFSTGTVNALATASLEPSQTSCAIPMAVCAPGGVLPAPKSWLTGHFGTGNGATGNFNWIDFTPKAGNEVADLLKGPGSCSIASKTIVYAEPGNMGASVAMAWNSRFGIYHKANGYDAEKTPPDLAGYSYTKLNWPAESDALPDFLARRKLHTPYSTPNENSFDDGNNLTGLAIKNPYSPTKKGDHETYGADRRLVVVPLVNCAGWGSGHSTNTLGWACILMLHPVAKEADDVSVEYIGLANDPDGSPCASSGIAGNSNSLGPLVPALVQ